MGEKALNNPRIPGGYILLPRQYQQTDLWAFKPIAWRNIWVHIKMHVNYKKGEPNPKLPRGCGIFSYARAEPLLPGITINQWQRCINWLRKEGWISARKTPRGLVITDLTYDIDQNPDNYISSKPETRQPDLPLDTPAAPTRTGRRSWLTPYEDVWRECMQGNLSIGIARKVFAPLRRQHDDAKVLTHLRSYLKSINPQYVSLPKFSETFGAWAQEQRGNTKTKGDMNNANDYA